MSFGSCVLHPAVFSSCQEIIVQEVIFPFLLNGFVNIEIDKMDMGPLMCEF